MGNIDIPPDDYDPTLCANTVKTVINGFPKTSTGAVFVPKDSLLKRRLIDTPVYIRWAQTEAKCKIGQLKNNCNDF